MTIQDLMMANQIISYKMLYDIKNMNKLSANSYNFDEANEVDEVISRIEMKLEDISNELKSLITILENCNAK